MSLLPSPQRYRNLDEQNWWGDHIIGQDCALAIAGESVDGHPMLMNVGETIQVVVAGTRLYIYSASSSHCFAEMPSEEGTTRVAIPKGEMRKITVVEK